MRWIWAAILAAILTATPAVAQRQYPPEVRAAARHGHAICRVQVGSSSGSGCYLGSRTVATCSHVWNGEATQRCTVQFPRGAISGQLARIEPGADYSLILLDREPQGVPAVPMASQPLRVGETAVVCGYDGGQTVLYRPARVTGHVRGASGVTWVEIGNPVQSGSSGGPLLNSRGEFVGPLWGAGGGQTVANTYSTTCRLFQRWGWKIKGRGVPPPSWGSLAGAGQSPGVSVQPVYPQPPTEVQPPQVEPQPPSSADLRIEVGSVQTVASDQPATVRAERIGADRVRFHFQIPQGPAGATGPAGPASSVDVDRIAAAITRTLPPITFRTVDSSGKVRDTETVPLGGVLNLHHRLAE
jgi:hypothetical protein